MKVDQTPEGAAFNVKVIAGASCRGVAGTHGDALKVKVRAVREKGRANKAVVSLLADFVGVPKAAVHLTGGAASTLKRIVIAGISVNELNRRLNRTEADSTSGKTSPRY